MLADPHSPWVEELLKNNHSPSDQAVLEIKGYLITPLRELEDLNAQILELKNRLSELEIKRDETQTRISQYQSILAPIRRIPPDVLREIFLHCLPTHRNPIIKCTECPLLLTRICNSWRVVAVSSPRLWECIYITFTDDDTLPDLESASEMVRNRQLRVDSGWQCAHPKSEHERMTAVLRGRYEVIKEWISRSGTRPLSIFLSFPTVYWYKVPYSKRSPGVMMELLSFLATLATRWRHLELKISPEIYEVLEEMIPSPSEMTALTSLSIEYPCYFPAHRGRNHCPKLFQAPRLQTIYLATSGNITKGIESSVRWSHLTHISFLDHLTFAQTADLFQRSPNLVYYKGTISYPGNGATPVSLHQEGYISLPFLESLSISQYATPQREGNMYARIDAPSLKSFSYAASFSTDTPDSRPVTAANSILPFLQKSTKLQKLTIDIDLKRTIADDITPLLNATPTITELVIGHPGRHGVLQSSLPPSQLDHDIFGFPKKDLRGFGNLIVCEESKDNRPPFLPRLTSLIILSPNAPISDETLLDLIKSRMMLGRTAALEHVKLISPRQRKKDIEGELARYANLVGGKIKLDLTYPPPLERPPRMDTISPIFGLSEFSDNEESWPYIDAGPDYF